MLAGLPEEQRLQYQLRGGDDYELLFTVRENSLAQLLTDWGEQSPALHPIGMITESPGIELMDGAGRELPLPGGGFEHF